MATEDTYLLCCQYFPQFINIFLKKLNIEVTIEHIEKICLCDNNGLETIKKYNIRANQICLENASLKCNHTLMAHIIDQRIEPTTKCFENIIQSKYKRPIKKSCINLLIGCGYVLTRDEFIQCLNNSILIENISRFSIDVDEEISNICYNNNLNPTTFKLCQVTIKTLETMLKAPLRRETRFFKTFINKHKIVPDEACLLAAIKHYSRSGTFIKFLVEKGAPFTHNCLLKSSIAQGCTKRTLTQMISLYLNYCKTQTSELENYKKENEKLKKKIKKLKKKKIKIHTKSVESTSDIIVTLPMLTIIVPDNIKVPKRQRQKVNPPPKLVEYLKLDNKKISFLDARKLLLDHIRENNFFGINKSQIDLPEDFRNLLGIESNGYIDFADIDKIVSLCYKK